jgi:hypothetical protein
MHTAWKTPLFHESRLLGYNWNTERLAKETPIYADGIDNPIDAVTHTVAATTHLVTGALDSVLGDAVRLLQGQSNRIPLNAYSGDLPRLKLDAGEAVQSLTNVFRTKGLSLLTLPLIAFRAAGDAFGDGADLLAGVHRPKSHSLAA